MRFYIRTNALAAAAAGLALLIAGTSAQSIADLPKCAQGPVVKALTSSDCGITNIDCVCRDKELHQQLKAEIASMCSNLDLKVALAFAGKVCNLSPEPASSPKPTHTPQHHETARPTPPSHGTTGLLTDPEATPTSHSPNGATSVVPGLGGFTTAHGPMVTGGGNGTTNGTRSGPLIPTGAAAGRGAGTLPEFGSLRGWAVVGGVMGLGVVMTWL